MTEGERDSRGGPGSWRPVVGYEGLYDVSSLGQVWSHPRHGTRGGVLTWAIERIEGAYPKVLLYDGTGKRRTRKVHHLVLEAFVGPCPLGQEARHLDGNPLNADLVNLIWGTPTANHWDRVRHGTAYAYGRRVGEQRPEPTHCKHGHKLTPANTRATKTGRACLACERIRQWRRKAA